MPRTPFASDFRTEPYWWREFRPAPLDRPLLERRADVAVVGGGYAGLSAARALALRGFTVAVFEADDFGSGASTRSGGALSAGLSIGKSLTGKTLQYPPSTVATVLGLAREAFEYVFRLVREENIDCRLEKTGRFLGACAPGHYRWLEQRFEKMQRAGISDCRLVKRAEQRSEIGSDYYHGGLVFGEGAKLQPALFYRGLLEACKRLEAITLSDHNRVTRFERSGRGWRLSTEQGEFDAQHLLVCTNGYTGRLTPWLRRRLVPVASHIIVTEPLPASVLASISPRGRTFSESRRITHYFRLTPDGTRLMFGGRSRFTETPHDLNARLLHRDMTVRFPELADTKIAHVWQGNVAFTSDALPHAGEIDGVHYVAGCNGSGISMMPYLGSQVAQKIAGRASRTSAIDSIPLPRIPLYNGTPWFLPLVGNYFRVRDFIDEKIL